MAKSHLRFEIIYLTIGSRKQVSVNNSNRNSRPQVSGPIRQVAAISSSEAEEVRVQISSTSAHEVMDTFYALITTAAV
jgi:4-hydroxy-3-methylbut-2-en-1-yl diphosphate synthase IspG/GcpE